MDDTPEQLNEARDSIDGILVLASALLLAGAPIKQIRSRYVVVAFDLLAEAEAQALLAAHGDHAAQRALERAVAQLKRLREDARDELGRYPRDADA